MRKVKTEEKSENAGQAFFADGNFPPVEDRVARRADFNLIEQHAVLHKVWAFAGYLLFYFPGVFFLYLVAFFMSDYFVGGDYSADNFVFSFVFVGFGIFLTMLGIKKLKNLKYLQVVAAILAVSFAYGFTVQILERNVFPRSYKPRTDFDYQNLIAFFTPIFLLVAALVGLAVKRRLDREETDLG